MLRTILTILASTILVVPIIFADNNTDTLYLKKTISIDTALQYPHEIFYLEITVEEYPIFYTNIDRFIELKTLVIVGEEDQKSNWGSFLFSCNLGADIDFSREEKPTLMTCPNIDIVKLPRLENLEFRNITIDNIISTTPISTLQTIRMENCKVVTLDNLQQSSRNR